ncbi:MAG: heme-dependent oxidative N-demethylase subunit alpha family protein [Opitutaceae bacterium]
MSLAELFPDGDYRFHLTLRRAEPREFFAPRDSSGSVLAERAQWLDTEPGKYAAILPEGEAALREFATMASTWDPAPGDSALSTLPALQVVHRLGRSLEPDLLFLSADEDGEFRLRGGALCFPTGWALDEKLGHTIEIIHGVVPGLNAALAAPIRQFLSRLKPGTAFLRENWGVAATEEMNLHPSRGVAAPELPVALDRLWLRVEHQALVALPVSRGIVFGIRIALHPLKEVAAGPYAQSFRHALGTMPAEMVVYKRLEQIREHLLNML